MNQTCCRVLHSQTLCLAVLYRWAVCETVLATQMCAPYMEFPFPYKENLLRFTAQTRCCCMLDRHGAAVCWTDTVLLTGTDLWFTKLLTAIEKQQHMPLWMSELKVCAAAHRPAAGCVTCS